MNVNLTQFLPAAVMVAIILTVILTEIIKKADKKDRLKGYRIYVPAILSGIESAVLAFGEFFTWKQVPFYWAVIFAVSVFGYEAIYRKIKTWIGIDEAALAVVGLFALGILTGSFLFRKRGTTQTEAAQKAKEEKKNEIESTPADVLVSAADNADELCREKDRIKTDFRERIQNRLNEELHRLGSSGSDSDCGAGSGTGN